MFNNVEMGKKIKDCRTQKKWSQDVLAEKVDVCSRQTISSWERGDIDPPLSQFGKLCEVFECDSGYFLGEHETKRYVTADIQKATGLSEDAIKNLVNCFDWKNKSQTLHLDIISELLCNPGFFVIIGQASRYIGSMRKSIETEHLFEESKSKKYSRESKKTAMKMELTEILNQETSTQQLELGRMESDFKTLIKQISLDFI